MSVPPGAEADSAQPADSADPDGGAAIIALLERIAPVAVPPQLLRDILLGGAADPSGTTDSNAGVGLGHAAEVVLAARMRLRALAEVLQDALFGGIADDGADEVILLHDNVFVAAASEPLIALTGDDIGFDPAALRRRLCALAGAHDGEGDT